jgi:hypothetical protein
LSRARALAALFLAAAAIAAGTARAQLILEDRTRKQNEKSNWELEQEQRDWKEGEVKLPDYPKTENLQEFFVSAASNFHFYIDAASLAVGPDGVVRYTLVARSATGYANVSYEGIRCATSSYRIYAIGDNGRWTPKNGEWREIEPRTVQRWHIELRHRYFCPGRTQIQTAAEGLDALRRGGHPFLSDFRGGR